MNIKRAYLITTFTVLFALIYTLSCSIETLLNITKNPDSINFPKWDLKFDIPILEKTVNLGELLDPESEIGKEMLRMKDASFDRVDIEEISPGGKYYYPDYNNFGLKEGDYIINFELNFPGTDELLSKGGLDTSLDSFFNKNLIFTFDSPFWPLPVDKDLILDPGDLANFDLSSVLMDINGDGSSDVDICGIISEDASLTLRVWVEKDGATIVPSTSEVSINNIKFEGMEYVFDPPVVGADGLLFSSSNFLSPDTTPPYYVDFAGDASHDKTKINFEGLSLSLKSGGIPKSGNFKLKIEAIINYGAKYKIVGNIYPMNFELGVHPVDISKLDTKVDPSSDGVEILLSHFISSLSLDNAAIYLKAINTLPLSIDITSMFDQTTDAVINPPFAPVPIGSTGNGGIISYFDLTGDPTTDSFEILSFDDPQNVIIKGWSGGEPAVTQVVLYPGNSNMGDSFIEKIFVGEDLRRPRGLFFINNFDTVGLQDVEVGMFQNGGGLTMQAGLFIPISIKVGARRDGVDILESIGFTDFPLTGDMFKQGTDQIPLDDIKEIGFRIKFTNHLPVGVNLQFIFYSDVTDASGNIIDTDTVFLMNNADNSADILYGNLTLGLNGEYYIGSDLISEFVLGIRENFKYVNSTGEHIYDGSFLSFLKERNSLKMKLKIALLPTIDSLGNQVSVRVSDDNYFSVKVDALGMISAKLK
ncbi:MAG TPA: hypothetical protein P5322_05930 [Spirochaetota bacterium]|nr:hypothetical protein [Spirochaetota bacterium]